MTGKKRTLGDKSIRVICHAGYRHAERPAFVDHQGIRRRVVEIRRSWRDPEFEYFEVTLDDSQILLLRHTLDREDWTFLESR